MFMSISRKFLFLHDIQLSIFGWNLIHWDSEKLFTPFIISTALIENIAIFPYKPDYVMYLYIQFIAFKSSSISLFTVLYHFLQKFNIEASNVKNICSTSSPKTEDYIHIIIPMLLLYYKCAVCAFWYFPRFSICL